MEIKTVDLKNIAVRQSQYPEDKRCEFLLVGRSNVGKSSFINTLISRKNYARTSSKPGKTQTLNFYLVNTLLNTHTKTFVLGKGSIYQQCNEMS